MEYIEDYDVEVENPLKYEQTQNRDLIKTIERINRSEKFKGSANDIINIIYPILKTEAPKLLREVWRSAHETHEDPAYFELKYDIVPPVHKKVHPEGDTDKFFRMHKEYPFYYLMNLKLVARFAPNADDKMANDESWYSRWFLENVFPKFSKKLLGKIKSELDMKFSNIFAFPTLVEDNTANKETVEDAIKYEQSRINIIPTANLRFNKPEENVSLLPSEPSFVESQDIRNVLVYSTSMALERIIRV